MANNVSFEGKDRRMPGIEKCLAEYGLESLEAARDLCTAKGIDVDTIVRGAQPIAFENAVWAYTLGTAVAIQKNVAPASEAAAAIGIGLQAFCVPGSVADQRKVGLGHGNLGKMLLSEETECFCFLAGHESFAAAEGAIGIARSANKARKEPLRVILNGLGKDAAQIISRINGFTYVETKYDYLEILENPSYVKASSGSLYGVLDVTGKVIVPIEYDYVGRMCEDIIVVRKDDKYGCFNKDGEMVVPMDYEEIREYVGGMARIRFMGKFGFIDRKGNIVGKDLVDEELEAEIKKLI